MHFLPNIANQITTRELTIRSMFVTPFVMQSNNKVLGSDPYALSSNPARLITSTIDDMVASLMLMGKKVSNGGLQLRCYLKLMLHKLLCNGAVCGLKAIQHIML